MPKFKISLLVTNNSGFAVTAHVGASLVGMNDWVEYNNTSDDVKKVFNPGSTTVVRYLSSALGAYQKYRLVVALWEGEKPIGKGIKYATVTKLNAVEKKKKKQVNMAISVTNLQPTEFVV